MSTAIIVYVECLGLRKGHPQFGCYLLGYHSGYFFTGNLDGGSYMTRKGKIEVEDEGKRLGGRGWGVGGVPITWGLVIRNDSEQYITGKKMKGNKLRER